MKHGTLKLLITGLVGLAQTVAAEPFTEDDINRSFYPYKDWTPTAGAFKRLMDEWRRAGRAGRQDDDALWERFKAAQDAFHVAISAVHGMDFLLTWNCRHINNVNIIRRLERLCAQSGFTCPVICSPDEMLSSSDA